MVIVNLFNGQHFFAFGQFFQRSQIKSIIISAIFEHDEHHESSLILCLPCRKINIMKKLELLVENIKCGGCMTSIKKGILELAGVMHVDIALEEEKITIEGDRLNRAAILKKLDGMGYPEKGNNTLFKEAKSYVSCAIGKVSA